ncbi:hypothetical protein AQUCO_03000407v1 [Aquilegia coerulea]|uniref:Pentacotripeptide-repeat region of PRORP domain-containing protein n=1 Tax=Aquilegia coerulea TaxID=218851 RepID=A0A2G5D2U7_AQUCA|nr:hypothetical protein AQUCO_03000407v1 [Aquilegia coerulea]
MCLTKCLKNVYTWNAIVSGCVKGGNLEDAQNLFVKMPERNSVSWNTMISALVRSGLDKKALSLYCRMNSEGFESTHFTFASVLSACGNLLFVEHGRCCHGLVIKVGIDCNKYVENAVVGMYAKCGCMGEAVRAFDRMSQPNEVSFTSMIGGLAQTDHVDEALRIGEGGEQRGSYENFEFPSYRYGQQVHGLAGKFGFEGDIHVGNSLIDMYAKHGNMKTAEMVFANLPEVNVCSWNVLIAGYGQEGQSDKALELLQRMQSHGFEPDEVTYVSMLGACVKSGDIETGREMFDRIESPIVSAWNAILSGYSQKGQHEEAVDFFRNMQFQNVRPDRTTLASILSSCAGMGILKIGKQVHAASTKEALHLDIFVASGLVDMYSKCGTLETATCIFERMPERDIVCWNSMIAGLASHSLSSEALALFKQMRGGGMVPTQFSYASILSSCSTLASLCHGRQIHAQVVKDGYTSDVFVGSALIDMYSKCGDVDRARLFFDGMHEKNVVSWNEMIHGYAQNGCGDKAVEIFEDMIRLGEKPDGITFIAVLTACSHSGLVDVGMKILDSMEQEHMVQPSAEHYTCVLDLLGRAGHFRQAEVLIGKMPCKDDPILWEVLLSGCRLHNNVNLGRRAAEQLFRLDPHNPAPYLLLANMYSSLGRWDDSSAIRTLMCDKGVIKNPGYSLIENQSEGCSG